MMKYTASLLITLSLLFFSCIEEFKIPQSVANTYESMVVIQGRILAGEESIIYVQYAQALGSLYNPVYIQDAKVTVIGQNGYESEMGSYDEENHYYRIDTRNLNANTLYAVQVEADGEIYQSEFQEILPTPEIDELTYKEREDGISIHVSTHAENDAPRLYMWTFEEDWEFHAELDISQFAEKHILYEKERSYPNVTHHHNPYYYCWQNRQSSQLFLYDTTPLEENAVKNHELFRIPIDDQRISYIYCITLKQWTLNEKSYEYYRLIKLYSEESGGLFSPIPTEVKGNVKCISDDSKDTKGFVVSSNVTTKRMFIYASDFTQVTPEYEFCHYVSGMEAAKNDPTDHWKMAWSEEMNKNGAIILTGNDRGEIQKETSTLYLNYCVDCRKSDKATKKRPDFWPNNHE